MSNPSLSATRLNITKLLSDPSPILKLNGIPILTRGNISTIVGPPKSRKTFLSSMLVASVFSKRLFDFSSDSGAVKILWIDTEQAMKHCAKTYRRINTLRGNAEDCDQPDLIFLCFRDFSAKERFSMTKEAIESYRPDLVVIDGVADLIEENNNEHDASDLQDFLLQTTAKFNNHIIAVIHSNVGSEKARGHTGSNLVRKCETIMQLSPADASSKVSFTSRDVKPNDFAFSIDDDGLPFPCELPNRKKPNKRQILKAVLNKGEAIPYNSLVERVVDYRKQCDSPISVSTAKQFITAVFKEGLIKCCDRKYSLSNKV